MKLKLHWQILIALVVARSEGEQDVLAGPVPEGIG